MSDGCNREEAVEGQKLAHMHLPLHSAHVHTTAKLAGKLKGKKGVHRVYRVMETDTSGAAESACIVSECDDLITPILTRLTTHVMSFFSSLVGF